MSAKMRFPLGLQSLKRSTDPQLYLRRGKVGGRKTEVGKGKAKGREGERRWRGDLAHPEILAWRPLAADCLYSVTSPVGVFSRYDLSPKSTRRNS